MSVIFDQEPDEPDLSKNRGGKEGKKKKERRERERKRNKSWLCTGFDMIHDLHLIILTVSGTRVTQK